MAVKSASRPRAVLLGVQLPGVSEEEFSASLDELARLGKALGLEIVVGLTRGRERLVPGAVVGAGKLRELARLTGGEGGPDPGGAEEAARVGDAASPTSGADPAEGAAPASLVLVDHELGPSQARNLERATGAEVLDRSAVILAIFSRHARSREARLQVEIARLNYIAPRLRETGGGRDREGGGKIGRAHV